MAKRQPLFMHLSVAEESREQESKGKYPKGKVGQLFDTFKANLPELTKVNLWFMLFVLPFFIAIVWGLPFYLNKVALQFNFSGNIGIGYPGASDDPILGQVALLRVYFYFFALLIPMFAVMGVGLAGMFNCAKKYMWGEEVKVTRCFFRGVKKYWWKTMLLMLVLGIIIFIGGAVVLGHVKLMLLGQATAWSWVFLIAVLLCLLPSLLAIQYMLPQVTIYDDIKLTQHVKNGYIFFFSMPLVSLVVFTIYAVPLVLIGTMPMFGMLVYLLTFMFGFVFFGLMDMALGMYAGETYITPLYNAKINQKLVIKNVKKRKYKDTKSVVTKATPKKDVAEVETKAEAKVNAPKTTNKSNKPYNPKKQKKNAK